MKTRLARHLNARRGFVARDDRAANLMNDNQARIKAAEAMDWVQVVLNNGAPCFRVEEDGHFCGRAKRWPGHDESHKFVSLADLLREMTQ